MDYLSNFERIPKLLEIILDLNKKLEINRILDIQEFVKHLMN
jgi:hypothetical protein